MGAQEALEMGGIALVDQITDPGQVAVVQPGKPETQCRGPQEPGPGLGFRRLQGTIGVVGAQQRGAARGIEATPGARHQSLTVMAKS